MTGTGTALDPYIITSVTDLQDMNNDLDAYYELGNDIDASDTTTLNPTTNRGEWQTATYYALNDYILKSTYTPARTYICAKAHTSGTWSVTNWVRAYPPVPAYLGFVPIGRVSPYFTGTLDGKEYKVTDLTITLSSIGDPSTLTGGFISRNDGTIQDIGFTDCQIEATNSDGHVYVGGIVYSNWGTIRDSHITGTVSGIGNSGGNNWTDVGGLVAYNNLTGTIENCWSNVTVTSEHNKHATAGGIAAHNWGTIEESYALGTATATSSSADRTALAGGLVASNGYAGYTDGIINNSYARGNASASGGADATAGGLVATSPHADSVITNSFSTGIPTGDTTGGLCASNIGTITNCFWDTQTSGQATSAGGMGKTTAQMKAIATFSGWSIALTTAANPTSGYPFLGWQVDLTNTWLIYGAGGAISPRLFVPIEDKVTLELIRNVEMSAGGRVFVDKSGYFHYDSRFARMR